jgi:hypothetical protein
VIRIGTCGSWTTPDSYPTAIGILLLVVCMYGRGRSLADEEEPNTSHTTSSWYRCRVTGAVQRSCSLLLSGSLSALLHEALSQECVTN